MSATSRVVNTDVDYYRAVGTLSRTGTLEPDVG
jgi:hypothetical protein